MSRPFPTLAAALAATAFTFAAVQAQAHAMLMKSDPVANSTISSPKVIHLEFMDGLAKKFSTFKLTDTDGNLVPLMAMDSNDTKVLEAMPSATLTPGLYTVTWTAASSSDGHKMSGNYSFTVK